MEINKCDATSARVKLAIAIHRLLGKLGIEVRRRAKTPTIAEVPRSSFEGVFLQAKKADFHPGTIIDVGTAYGEMAIKLAAIFPDAGFLLIEALDDYRRTLPLLPKKSAGRRLFGPRPAAKME
ncbi:MAG: hypothetical protein M3R69_04510 [Acidobacteriota bacterium]|nr:hypothetical protein [Acidobacteriota bacterium]